MNPTHISEAARVDTRGNKRTFQVQELFKYFSTSITALLLTSLNTNGSRLYNPSETDVIQVPYSQWHKIIDMKIGEPLYRSPDRLYQRYATKSLNVFVVSDGDFVMLIRELPS